MAIALGQGKRVRVLELHARSRPTVVSAARCNPGGREQTANHCRQLLSEAGSELTAQHELPLDVALLRAGKPEPDTIRRHAYGDKDV
ncbi:MAG: hypothetical protein M3460_10575 [Actinomycetota bacterium]|nr:hypothetical protein [Actinomycetota bacterium]